MCLRIKVENPQVVLAEGNHLGFDWVVVHNKMGFRCGYIRVPESHPWHGKNYDDIEVSCHGGLTFAEHDVLCDKGGADNGYWIGFDCAHFGDSPDPIFADSNKYADFMRSFEGDVVRDQEYVENECRSMCEQAQKAA